MLAVSTPMASLTGLAWAIIVFSGWFALSMVLLCMVPDGPSIGFLHGSVKECNIRASVGAGGRIDAMLPIDRMLRPAPSASYEPVGRGIIERLPCHHIGSQILRQTVFHRKDGIKPYFLFQRNYKQHNMSA